MEPKRIDQIYKELDSQFLAITTRDFENLSDPIIFKQHVEILNWCSSVVLAKEFKRFIVDDNNRDVIRFLLLYFNNCKEAESLFPEKNYKISKNLMICGTVGVGKTLIMQVFSEYLRITRNPNAFQNVSVTQMINYYKIHNHLDKYTYNEDGVNCFEGNPLNICLNDVGLQTHQHFGADTKIFIQDFFFARNEIWSQTGKYAHITTNLSAGEIKEYFEDEHGRLADRFKTYNVVPLGGDSRR